MNKNIIKHSFSIHKELRASKLRQKPKLIWFTGLSGSGKSTLSNKLEEKLFKLGFATYSLDGDNVRSGINKNLGFTEIDRQENIRRIGEISKLMLDAGLIVLASFISPFEKDREKVKTIVGNENYIEIFVNTPLETCEKRDVKGLYKKARSGVIKNFTGISSKYEIPKHSDLIINTDLMDIDSSVEIIKNFIIDKINL